MQKTNKANDVVFLMVDLIDGQRETVDKAKKHISDNDLSFSVYINTEQNAAYTYAISSIPSTLFIDVDGNIAVGVQGTIDEETLLKGLGLIQIRE